jgi:transcriptional regulator with XRE-family HTH domain/oxalate decarboxylase/phosphoglucose isomerase-like protein (cupin superfamily)
MVPVYSEIPADYRSLKLGERIRSWRRERAWTLREMSDRLSTSVAALSAIENDRVVLDLERLLAISDVLGVRLHQLFPKNGSCHFHVIPRASLETIPPATVKTRNSSHPTPPRYPNVLRPLAGPFVGKSMEPFHIQVLPSDSPEFVSHGHEEFFFVLRGEVECLLKTPDGLVSERLGPGDCMYLWSHLPHCIRAAGNAPAESVHLIYSGYGATDGAELTVVDQSQRTTLSQEIGSKVAAFRKSEGLSQANFGRLVDIRPRRLNEIEHGRRPVSIEMLLRICQRFRKPLEYFLASTMIDKPFHTLVRAAAIGSLPMRLRRRLPDGSWLGSEFRPLAAGFGPRGMHPYYAKLRQPEGSEVSLHVHHGQEFLYVVKGDVNLVTVVNGDRTTHMLSSGDMCFIDSTVPHRFIGMGVSPFEESSAEVIDVFWCPLGESYLFSEDGASPADDVAVSPAAL